MKIILVCLLLVFFALPGCGYNRAEYERMKSLRDEYLTELAEARQTNEIINRNIFAAYQEIEVLRNRLEERRAQERNNIQL
jgi:hypothetical protein